MDSLQFCSILGQLLSISTLDQPEAKGRGLFLTKFRDFDAKLGGKFGSSLQKLHQKLSKICAEFVPNCKIRRILQNFGPNFEPSKLISKLWAGFWKNLTEICTNFEQISYKFGEIRSKFRTNSAQISSKVPETTSVKTNELTRVSEVLKNDYLPTFSHTQWTTSLGHIWPVSVRVWHSIGQICREFTRAKSK